MQKNISRAWPSTLTDTMQTQKYASPLATYIQLHLLFQCYLNLYKTLVSNKDFYLEQQKPPLGSLERGALRLAWNLCHPLPIQHQVVLFPCSYLQDGSGQPKDHCSFLLGKISEESLSSAVLGARGCVSSNKLKKKSRQKQFPLSQFSETICLVSMDRKKKYRQQKKK